MSRLASLGKERHVHHWCAVLDLGSECFEGFSSAFGLAAIGLLQSLIRFSRGSLASAIEHPETFRFSSCQNVLSLVWPPL
jgi:hypothetical protein